MIGKISKYDEISGMGYILGYDELTYFYHQNSVIKNENLKEGDIVSFDYILEKNQDQLPYAINIVKEEYKGKNSVSYKEAFNNEKNSSRNYDSSSEQLPTAYEKKTWFEKFENFVKRILGKKM